MTHTFAATAIAAPREAASKDVPLSRQPLVIALAAFRREFIVIGIMSLTVNLLMLAPTLYMLQV